MEVEEIIGQRIGDWLVGQGELSRVQLDEILELQRSGDRRLFGEIAVDLEYIDIDSVIRFLEGRPRLS